MTRWFVVGLLVVAGFWVAMRSLTREDDGSAESRETTVTAIDRESVRPRTVAPRRGVSAGQKKGDLRSRQTAAPAQALYKGPANMDFAALPDADDAHSSAPLIRVSGKTLFQDNSAASRVPVVAVLVDLDGEMEVVGRTESAEDGSYELAVRHPGQLKLLAQLPGYTVAEASLGLLNAEFDSPPPFFKHLILYPISSISGRVTDAQGRPLAGAEVAVTLRLSGNHHPETNTAYQNYSTVVTTATGEFNLQGLPPWDAQVYASKSGYVLTGTTTTAPAKNIELVLRTNGAFIKGRVVDMHTSRGVEGASVRLTRFRGPNVYPKSQQYVADSDGYYTAGPLEEGGYLAFSEAEGYADINGQTILEVEDGVTSSGVDFLLHDGYRIRGTVSRLATGEPVPRADIYIGYLLDPLFDTIHLQADEDGKFIVEKFLPAMNEVKLTAKAPGLRMLQPENSYGAWVRPLPTDLLRDVPIEIKMVGEARVRGIVLDESGVPVPRIDVRIENFESNSLVQNGQTSNAAGDDGRFDMRLAAPATNFRLSATSATLAGATRVLSLLPGEETDVEIRLKPLPPMPQGMPQVPSSPMPGQGEIPGAIYKSDVLPPAK